MSHRDVKSLCLAAKVAVKRFQESCKKEKETEIDTPVSFESVYRLAKSNAKRRRQLRFGIKEVTGEISDVKGRLEELNIAIKKEMAARLFKTNLKEDMPKDLMVVTTPFSSK